MPEIESNRGKLVTESYKMTEDLPIIKRRSHAFAHILKNIPIVIRENELIVGSATVAPRGCQVFPEYSYEWLLSELDTVSTRQADPFYISEQTKKDLREIYPWWNGKTTSDLAKANMSKEAYEAFVEHSIFTPGNYFYNGIGHVCVDYGKVLKNGYRGIIAEAESALSKLDVSDSDYVSRSNFLYAVIESCEAVIEYARRYSALAKELASKETNPERKRELEIISKNCVRVPEFGATSFYEACQAFWFIQLLLQVESSGHSISPGRFDQYMYPYYKKDVDAGKITREKAQELLDCIWVKFNDINKVRDRASADGFAGYGMFQNLIVGGQDIHGMDATNDLSYMCIEAAMHVPLPQPSISIRVWNGSPEDLLIKAAALTRLGTGLPAYYNDEIIIPSIMARGLTLEDARDYCIIGCVEPQKAGKTDGWHDAAFFNMCRPMELVFSNGYDKGKKIGPDTGDVSNMKTFEELYSAYKTQQSYMIKLLVNANNAIDMAHATRCPLPFQSCMVEDCIGRGKSLQEGGAIYNFTGPQGFGIANNTDGLIAIKKLVFEEGKFTLSELKEAMRANFGYGVHGVAAEKLTTEIATELVRQGINVNEDAIRTIYDEVTNQTSLSYEQKARYKEIKRLIDEEAPKYGNDIYDVDMFARDVANTYTKEVQKYKNPRGGIFQAGLYPVSANVPLGASTGATPDGRLAYTPLADGIGPASGRDTKGPTATANSVAKLEQGVASNGTLLNQKFHPSALAGMSGLSKFVALIRSYFDQKGMHVQFNVVTKETLLDAQKNPEKYKTLVVRVAGYSALFTTLSRSLQDDIINRTEQGF
ncbi:MAG: glycyl radical protein [Clostridia bacterium]|nr:glycyl radical protein [Clostridia bacterium]MBQ3041219.1 glycyl radical protein [Clostridia bacterium]